MKNELALPAFQMDCRDWLVITPSESGLPEEVAGTPLLAVLSTVVLDSDDFRSVSAVLTVGLMDDDDDDAFGADGDWLAADALDLIDDRHGATARYVLPAPDGQLALLAEFTVSGMADAEISRRIDALMASFRWAT
jgi:hypothetical protein